MKHWEWNLEFEYDDWGNDNWGRKLTGEEFLAGLLDEVDQPVFDVVGGTAVVFVVDDDRFEVRSILGGEPLGIPVNRLGPVGAGVAPVEAHPASDVFEGVTFDR